MRIRRGWAALALAIAPGPGALADGPEAAEAHRKVLVELYSSQGAGSAPAAAAADLLGQLAATSHGVDHVVAVHFHVDDLDDPRADPFADPAHAARRRAYDRSSRREDREASPLILLDGRRALLATDRAGAAAGLAEALREAPSVAIVAELGGSGRRKVLAVKVSARASAVVGDDLIVGVALTQGPVTTSVTSGEDAGRTLVDHHVARAFESKPVRLDRAGTKALTFPLELPEGGEPGQFRVAIFVQDRAGGKVHQAESLPWLAPAEPKHEHRPVARRPRPRRPLDLNFANLFGTTSGQADPDESTTVYCPNCGSTYTIPGLVVQPNGPRTPEAASPPPSPPSPADERGATRRARVFARVMARG